ncbi:hypothetical protein J4Q44_G00197130 [Coregonus suidteri]|uniref:Uncharacterized protein n=1 Tax=Coregonus suidteri TaxID=861788 RepID=A0AAN8R2B2_9TELE
MSLCFPLCVRLRSSLPVLHTDKHQQVSSSCFVHPQEAHLCSEVKPVPDVGEEGLRVTGGAQGHTRPVSHCVIMDTLRQDPTPLEKYSGMENVKV